MGERLKGEHPIHGGFQIFNSQFSIRKSVRTATESPNAADEVRDLPDLKQRTNGYPLLGALGRGQGEGSTQVRNVARILK